jgi:putative heme-binding domain-containing protein
MTPHDILESIIEPSKVVADQYQNTLFTFQDGDVLSGRVLGEDDKKLFVLSNGVPLTTMTLFKTNIVTRRLSKISPMPEGLVNAMTADEIMDLIACLQAGHRSTLPALNE